MSREKITAAQGGGSAICAEAQSDTSVEIETVPPEPTARSLKEKITPVEHTPYAADTKRPAVYDARCVGTAELRPCSPLDMIFRAHFSKGPGGLGSCVQLSANVAQCLRRANRFRTFKDCEAACKQWLTTMDHYEEESTVKFFLVMTLVVSAVVFVLLGLMLFGFVQGINNIDYSSYPTAMPKSTPRFVD
ncbi:uncharacterized protein LOC119374467 isoform X4 [Rhipicephalus sanguineus]|uniref:uncharacterized protein LOC119374467 isoform X4 n=1 Tax=Rhipicephalus sanguineus TaxID=34632 RepID=UPI00189378BE|nr:uncharacterized protein LOC119374467 isoform X4 [Rhipicephalus sanguineus]